ncbi:serine/threonine-protein kinase [Longimicrobium sp.]|uniref:serine/threonine-protein kinase n=1 Tax=Longimicrobium sp. TaxID=2029185 RepID=UPI003B3A0592
MRAVDESPADDDVAVKIYLGDGQDERVRREISAMSRIRHRSLATLVEAGELTLADERLQYCAWEHIRGTALDQRLQSGPLALRALAAVGRDVAGAIGTIWVDRIVHRDISPKNVMLRTGEREAVLIDLGVARHLGSPSLTEYGFSWGTPGYLSPEQCNGVRDLTCKSDIFALGVVLLECASGRHPTRRLQQPLITSPPRAASVMPTMPVVLAEMIDAMLSVRAVSRPRPDEVAATMASYLEATANVLS